MARGDELMCFEAVVEINCDLPKPLLGWMELERSTKNIASLLFRAFIYLLSRSNFWKIVSKKVFCGAKPRPRRIGILYSVALQGQVLRQIYVENTKNAD